MPYKILKEADEAPPANLPDGLKVLYDELDTLVKEGCMLKDGKVCTKDGKPIAVSDTLNRALKEHGSIETPEDAYTESLKLLKDRNWQEFIRYSKEHRNYEIPGRTHLMWEALKMLSAQDRVKAIDACLSAGMSPDTKYKGVPIVYSATLLEQPEVVAMLKLKGADMSATTPNGDSAQKLLMKLK